MARPPRRALALAAALALLAAAAAAADPPAAAGGGVDAELRQLDDSIHSAEAGLRNAHEKKDVVDLGASLRLVEERFAGLRGALLSQMGAAGGGGEVSQAGAMLRDHAKDLAAKGSQMISKLSTSRSQVHAVLAEVRTMDMATSELKAAITKLEKEIADLGTTLQQAHTDNGVLFSAHADLRQSVKDVHSHSQAFPDAATVVRGFVPKWYYVVLVEFAVLVLFGAYKVVSLRRRGDKFSKLG